MGSEDPIRQTHVGQVATYGIDAGIDGAERPFREKRLRVGPAGDWLTDVPASEEMPELCKKLCPFSGTRNEDVAFVGIVALAAQIAERAQSIQGSGNYGLRDVQRPRQSADRMRAGIQIHKHQQRHLPLVRSGSPERT
jgi:hypothetical protein